MIDAKGLFVHCRFSLVTNLHSSLDKIQELKYLIRLISITRSKINAFTGRGCKNFTLFMKFI